MFENEDVMSVIVSDDAACDLLRSSFDDDGRSSFKYVVCKSQDGDPSFERSMTYVDGDVALALTAEVNGA